MKISFRILTPVALVAAIVAVASGCGGDDSGANASASGGPITTSSLSKAEFVQQANALCIASKKQLAVELKDFAKSFVNEHPNQTAASDAFPSGLRSVVLPWIQRDIDGIRELGAPPGEANQIEAILVATEDGIENVNKHPDIAAVKVFSGFKHSGELAREYGIEACTHG